MPYLNTFFESIRTAVKAVEISVGVAAFNEVWIAPFLDVDRLLDSTRLPAAVIIDNGGSVSAINGDDEVRRFTIAIVETVPRDHIGEDSIQSIFNLGEVLVDALVYDDTLSVYSSADNDLEAVGTDTENLLLIVKSYQFEAEFERSS